MYLAPTAESDSARPQTRLQLHESQCGRLTRNVAAMIAAHPKLTDLGHDDVVEHLADKHGFGRFDLSIHRIVAGGRVCTLAAVPERISRSDQGALVALKRDAAAAGRHVVLIHERFVQRQPRLSNWQMIAEASDTTVRGSDRLAILVHLVENGGYSTMADCAALVSNDAPLEVVLHLVADGVLRIRTDQFIGPNSRVDLVEAGTPN